MKRFRGGLVFKAHKLSHHSTLGSRVIKKKKKTHSVVAGKNTQHPITPRLWRLTEAAVVLGACCEDRVLDGPASGEKGSKGRKELDHHTCT